LRQRLVGAIVLVALAVIFLPMLFDGSGRPEQLDVAVEIPDRPEAPASTLDDIPETEPATTESESSPEPSADTEATADQAGAASRPDESAATDDAGGASAGGGTESQDGTEQGSSGAGADEPADGPQAWVVQVGSFSRETNAVVLRDRLRQKGFDAFTEQGESDGQTVWRVRVGPVATREDAGALQSKIEQERGKEALVMTYP